MTTFFADKITRFKLVAGLADKDIKLDVLSMQDKSLEETVKYIEGKDCGKIAREKVGERDTKVSVVKPAEPSQTLKRCKNCNMTGHN